MPVSQPRDRDGRYGTVPTPPPTATPAVPTHLHASGTPGDDGANSVTRSYRLFTDRADSAPTTGGTQAADGDSSTLDARDVDDSPEGWARTYHRRFRRFHRQTITATRDLLRARPSQLTADQRDAAFTAWLTTICATYGRTRPARRGAADADAAGGGYYQRSNHTITLSSNRPSVITLIHETRHALQHAGAGAPMVSADVEVDARAWSLSLYYQVRPALFRRMVREGRVRHIDPTVFD